MKIQNFLITSQNNKYLNNNLNPKQQSVSQKNQVVFNNVNDEEKERNKRRNRIIGVTIAITAAVITAAVLYRKRKRKIKFKTNSEIKNNNIPQSNTKLKNNDTTKKFIAINNNTNNIAKETNETNRAVNNAAEVMSTSELVRTTTGIENIPADLIKPDMDLIKREENKTTNRYNPKNIIKNDFLDFIAVEKKGYKLPEDEANGIMVVGKSKEEREKFVNWIIKEANVYHHKVTFDKNNPLESMHQIFEKARKAETIFPTNNTRTIIYVENLDDFFEDQSSENRKKIAKWNRFAEHASEQYHTTILFHTDKPKKLEAASIAPHRVSPRVYLSEENNI